MKLVVNDGGKPVLLYNNGACNSLVSKSVSCITDANSYTISKILDISRDLQCSTWSINSNIFLIIRMKKSKDCLQTEIQFPRQSQQLSKKGSCREWHNQKGKYNLIYHYRYLSAGCDTLKGHYAHHYSLTFCNSVILLVCEAHAKQKGSRELAVI